LAQTNPFRNKKGRKEPLRSEAKTRRRKKQRCFEKMQIQNHVAKTQNMASHRRRYAKRWKQRPTADELGQLLRSGARSGLIEV
jgi:hypothetical protein